MKGERRKVKGERSKLNKAQGARSKEKRLKKILATDLSSLWRASPRQAPHGCTRTGKINVRKRGGWEVRKMGSEWKLKAIRAES